MAVDHYVHHSRPGGSLEIADGLALQEKPRLKFTFQVLQEFRAAACFVKNAQDPHPGTRHPAGVCAERCRLPQQAVVVVAHPGERGVMQKPAVALGVRLHRAHTFAEAQELHLPQHRRVQRVLLAHLHLRVAVGKALQGLSAPLQAHGPPRDVHGHRPPRQQHQVTGRPLLQDDLPWEEDAPEHAVPEVLPHRLRELGEERALEHALGGQEVYMWRLGQVWS
mmetsp:Transcript_104809/g.249552  ORF Transcript_104809/g.249552 Transcript_104809/m.249552 type:complete len:222 (+) Transcript_104809:1204-1869(+)